MISDASACEALADPTRRDLLTILCTGERSASELAEPFEVSRSRISQQLGILRDAGLVERRREGRRSLYRLRAEPLEGVHDWISLFEPFWDDCLRSLGDYLDRTADDAVPDRPAPDSPSAPDPETST